MREGLVPIRKTVQRYGGGGFMVEGERIDGSMLMFADRAMPWAVSDFGAVSMESLAPVTEGSGAEILILGCGSGMRQVSPGLRESLRAAGLVVEPMDTGAACRTFNLLVSEDRWVAAALIAV